MDDMQRAFEAWAIERYPLRTSGDSYACGETHDAWQAWQAATMAERERCAKLCDAERSEFMQKAGKNDGRHSDMAFGSVNSAERLADAIRKGDE